MLLSLSIKDLVLIDTLHLNVEAGFSVLTGETGAGKSILLDALGLALGMRGDASLIRQGAEQAIVCAEFCIKDAPQITQLLQEHGLAAQSQDISSILVFRRVLSCAGDTSRSRAFVNDQMVSVGLLRLLGNALLEIHGQFDRLLDPTSYRIALDEFMKGREGPWTLGETVQRNFSAWQKAYGQWQEANCNLDALRQNRPLLVNQLEELEKLNPLVGEEENLRQERKGLDSIGKLSTAIQDSMRHLQGSPQTSSIESTLYAAIKPLKRLENQGNEKIDAAIKALEQALTETVEARAQIQDIVDELENSPRRLQEVDERLYALRSAARKYGVIGDGLKDLQQKVANQLNSLEQANDLLAAHAKAAEMARKEYYEAALTLHQRRVNAAKALEQAVMSELPTLMLSQAKFSVHITQLPENQWTQTGFDRVDFMVAMNKGQDLCGLSKSASGGELARFMLALKVALASRSSLPTIIFDEIDTGVGGAVASAIGERLIKLSTHVQVLAITHSPQLAAYATTHFLAFKEDQGAFMRTSVSRLAPEASQNELARMLSGSEVTVEAHAAAKQLRNAGEIKAL